MKHGEGEVFLRSLKQQQLSRELIYQEWRHVAFTSAASQSIKGTELSRRGMSNAPKGAT